MSGDPSWNRSSIRIAGLSISIAGLLISIAGLSIRIDGLSISIAGLSTSIAGLSISIAGLSISIAGLSISIDGLSISIDGVLKEATRIGRSFGRDRENRSPMSCRLLEVFGPTQEFSEGLQTHGQLSSELYMYIDTEHPCIMVNFEEP